MRVHHFFVGALLVVGALPAAVPVAGRFVPLRAHEPTKLQERADQASIAWPTHFRDQPLTQLPLGALEQRFARRFPGAIARYTDGRHILIVRHVTRPTRQLHPAEDCFRAVGYRIDRARPMIDDDRVEWGCFIATLDGRRVRVCERIHASGNDQHWTDVSAWFWASQYGGGPWWALTLVAPLESD
jgi:hypothetical protein